MTLFERFDTHRSKYDVFGLPRAELEKLVGGFEHRVPRRRSREYLALKWAGSFFAYDRPVVWVRVLVNRRRDPALPGILGARGLFVNVTTVDDCALYGTWNEPPAHEAVLRVLAYFAGLAELRTYKLTCADLDRVVGVKADSYDNS